MKEKILAIVNPCSSNGNTGKEWPAFEKMIKEAGLEFESQLTEYPGHATEIARHALKNAYEIIVSVGGDGTMNEVLNGFFENDQPINKNASLSVFSRGTGCDFARTMAIDNSVEAIIEILKNKKRRYLDIGKCRFLEYSGEQVDRYFLNVSDVGIGGETTYRVNRNSKALKGFLSFLIGTISTIAVYKNKKLHIVIDDKTFINKTLNTVVIANGKYFGGGMQIAPDAKIDDGLFDIIVLGNFSKSELIMNFPKIYKGSHIGHPKVERYRGKKIVIKSTDRVLIELDGEQPGTLNAEYHIIPKAISVLV